MDNQNGASTRRTLYSVAYGLYIAATVFSAPCLITMAWTIPMTIRMKHAMSQAGTPAEQSHLCVSIFGIIAFIYGIIFGLAGAICGIIASSNFKSHNK